MNIQTVTLSQLCLSPFNVRKVKPQGIDQLAADIAVRGQLQNLVVYAENGKFHIAAGGRRYRAFKKLAKAKTITSGHPVSVEVRNKADAIELSLAENAQREALHSADAVRAYGALLAGGKTPEDIAASFGVSVSYVKKVLRLSALHPAILAAFAKDEIGMDAAQALTLTDDPERQLLALKQGRNAHGIRRFLTSEKMGTDNALFAFVGLDAYQDGGGSMTADMFAEAGAGYANDPALVEQLASVKLAKIEADYKAQGWSDVRASLTRPDYFYNVTRMTAEGEREATPDEAAEQDRLTEAMTARLAEIGSSDAWGDDIICDLRNAVRTIEDGRAFFTEAQQASGAMMLFVGQDGTVEAVAIQIKRERVKGGIVLPAKSDYSGAMIETLTKIKTLGVQEAIANDPALALDILIDCLCGQIAHGQPSYAHPLSLRVEPFNTKIDPDLMTVSSINPLTEWQNDYFAAVPTIGRFKAIRAMEADNKARLLAILVAGMVNGVQPSGTSIGTRNACFERIAHASGVDMAAKWSAPEAFFTKLTKPTMLKAVAEAVSPDAAANCAKMSKSELAAACTGRIAGRGWLPPALRIALAVSIEDSGLTIDEAA
jgi:ParB family transcriptional regulator, chromosome partitioning protein